MKRTVMMLLFLPVIVNAKTPNELRYALAVNGIEELVKRAENLEKAIKQYNKDAQLLLKKVQKDYQKALEDFENQDGKA